MAITINKTDEEVKAESGEKRKRNDYKAHRPPTRRAETLTPGEKIGRLTVLYEVEPKTYYSKDGRMRYRRYWHCKCDCGNEKDISEKPLKRRMIMSCGCLKLEATRNMHRTHGLSNTRLYRVYASIKARCYNPNNKAYCNYGGRGIKMCSDWLNDFKSFHDWSYANGYNDLPYNNGGLSIDRIDNNGDYSPDNCRWATRKEQNNNTRSNRLITFNGETHSLAEWSRITGLEVHVIGDRIRKHGFSLEQALERRDFRRRENKRAKANVST